MNHTCLYFPAAQLRRSLVTGTRCRFLPERGDDTPPTRTMLFRCLTAESIASTAPPCVRQPSLTVVDCGSRHACQRRRTDRRTPPAARSLPEPRRRRRRHGHYVTFRTPHLMSKMTNRRSDEGGWRRGRGDDTVTGRDLCLRCGLQRRVAVRKFDSKCTRTAVAKIDILLKGYLTVSSLHLSQRVHVSVGYCKTITSFIYFYLFITDEAAY